VIRVPKTLNHFGGVGLENWLVRECREVGESNHAHGGCRARDKFE
jgi:hypothetical protein